MFFSALEQNYEKPLHFRDLLEATYIQAYLISSCERSQGETSDPHPGDADATKLDARALSGAALYDLPLLVFSLRPLSHCPHLKVAFARP